MKLENSIGCYVKQLGANARRNGEDESETRMSLNDPKGGNMAEWPEDLRVRQFPNTFLADAQAKK
jgi:hypothetical protein